MDKYDIFINDLIVWLKRKRVSASHLAKHMGVTASAVHFWLDKKNVMSAEKYFLIKEFVENYKEEF